MIKVGEQIGNLQTGETLTMLESAEGREDSFQRYQVVLPPHCPSPPLHYHLAFAETFTVVAGTLTMIFGREKQESILAAGQSLTAEVGVCHTFSNDRDQPCTMLVNTRPAGGVVDAFKFNGENDCRLCRARHKSDHAEHRIMPRKLGRGVRTHVFGGSLTT